ncbi:MAG TPA: thiamine diphosphokinase, partial [Acidimicrobiales bacterium]|nr:thiamine diphosphokinase [Acidimicrobiales bacterium]
VGGGGPPAVPPGGLGDLGADTRVVAADSGLEGARRLGLDVDVVVGDMDSVDPDVLGAAVAAGVPVERHPEAKDATDLDLALDVALARRPRPGRLVVVTGPGDRFDHALAVALALASPRYRDVAVEAWIGPAHLWVVRTTATLRGEPGALVSLLPALGPVSGVTTTGLLYPLTGEDLAAGTTRGVSNEMAGVEATVSVGSGVLLAVMPGQQGTHWRRTAP